MEKRRRKKQSNTTGLLALIAVLAVVLIVVICIAVGAGRDPDPNPTETLTQSTDPTETSGVKEAAGLKVTSLLGDNTETLSETAQFQGTSDPKEALTVNGRTVERNADGSFSCEVNLSLGDNEIVFTHKGESVSFSIRRRYVVHSFSPSGDLSCGSGATLFFQVAARTGSTVTAEFNGKTYSLVEADNQQVSGMPEGFSAYTASCKLTGTNTSDLDLGVITYTASCDGITETYTSGTITCQKASDILSSDPSVTPDYGDYIDVGSGYIVEIVNYAAETFDGDTRDDYSHPTNCYLPKGTVDYCSTQLVTNGDLQYVLMRCGRRVYVDKKNIPSSQRTQVSDRYAGQLPDHNEIGFVSMTQVDNHTVLTLDCLWKAPFYFDLLPQTYSNPNGGSERSYEVTACTATYIDITFCYATQFTGTVQIPAGNPLFKRAEVIQNESDCVLRLHLKETGGFYGWDCYYNDNDQLCFEFLNPAQVTVTDNAYGVDLTGITIMIDVGHGGADGGAERKTASGQNVEEADRNLALAKVLQTELQSMGATVVLNRTTDVEITVDDRIQSLRNLAPDLCIAIHHNALDVEYYGGFECYYYDAWSKLLAERIYANTKDTGVYANNSLGWHNYFVSRMTCCPVVLTENGYLSNMYDLNNTLDETALAQKAQAMAQGVADYFLLINE